MASSSLIFFMILCSVLLLISSSESTEHFVGDSERLWKVPLPSEEALFNWASNHHFTIGDTIGNYVLFLYNLDSDVDFTCIYNIYVCMHVQCLSIIEDLNRCMK